IAHLRRRKLPLSALDWASPLLATSCRPSVGVFPWKASRASDPLSRSLFPSPISRMKQAENQVPTPSTVPSQPLLVGPAFLAAIDPQDWHCAFNGRSHMLTWRNSF